MGSNICCRLCSLAQNWNSLPDSELKLKLTPILRLRLRKQNHTEQRWGAISVAGYLGRQQIECLSFLELLIDVLLSLCTQAAHTSWFKSLFSSEIGRFFGVRNETDRNLFIFLVFVGPGHSWRGLLWEMQTKIQSRTVHATRTAHPWALFCRFSFSSLVKTSKTTPWTFLTRKNDCPCNSFCSCRRTRTAVFQRFVEFLVAVSSFWSLLSTQIKMASSRHYYDSVALTLTSVLCLWCDHIQPRTTP